MGAVAGVIDGGTWVWWQGERGCGGRGNMGVVAGGTWVW